MLLAKVSYGFRLPLLAGLATLILSVAGASTGFLSFALTYGLCFGFVSGALYNHAISAATNSASATFLVPLSVAAFGLGGAVFGPAYVWLTASGWGLWSLAPAWACLAMVTMLAIVVRPANPPDMIARMPPQPMMRPNRKTVVLGIIFAAGSCSGLIVLGFASQILPRGAESVGLASLAIFLATIGNTLGRLSSAIIAGRVGPVQGIAGALMLSMIALSGLIFLTTPAMIIGLLFFVAFAYGQLAATMPLLVKSQVSGPSFSGAFGWVFIGWGIAGLVGPWTAGWVLDMTGTVRVSLILCIALAALSLWLTLKVIPPRWTTEDS